jgi:hypothetical protein
MTAMTEITAMHVILSLRPTATFGLDGRDIVWEQNPTSGEYQTTNLDWQSTDVSIPTKEEYDAEYTRLQQEFNSTEYQRLRKPEYPPLADLADALYWQSQGDESKMTAYLAAVDAVKQKYPKE